MTILKNSNCSKSKKKNAVVIEVSVVTVVTVVKVVTIVKKKIICHRFLAALSSSRSLVVGLLVGLSIGDVCEKVTFRVSKGK